MTTNIPLLNEFYSAAIQAIRKVDPNHIILLDPNLWATDITSFHSSLFSDPQIISAIHPYFQGKPSFDHLSSYPCVVDSKQFDRAALEKTLDGTYDLQRIPRPVMASEFGIWRSHPHSQPELVEMARSFAFASCEVHQDKLGILKPFLVAQ